MKQKIKNFFTNLFGRKTTVVEPPHYAEYIHQEKHIINLKKLVQEHKERKDNGYANSHNRYSQALIQAEQRQAEVLKKLSK